MVLESFLAFLTSKVLFCSAVRGRKEMKVFFSFVIMSRGLLLRFILCCINEVLIGTCFFTIVVGK